MGLMLQRSFTRRVRIQLPTAVADPVFIFTQSMSHVSYELSLWWPVKEQIAQGRVKE